MYLLEFTLQTPLAEGLVDIVPGREFARQHPLGAPCAYDIAARFEQRPSRMARRYATTTLSFKQIGD